jgi:GTPase SAR1 family protein
MCTNFLSRLNAVITVLLFRHPYERRAEKAAKGGARVVVVGPTCAGKTIFIKQFLKHAARR